jgi:hypothetical protein
MQLQVQDTITLYHKQILGLSQFILKLYNAPIEDFAFKKIGPRMFLHSFTQSILNKRKHDGKIIVVDGH